MDENRKTRVGCAPVGCGAMGALVPALILYVLLAGPLYRLVAVHGVMSNETFDTIYAPAYFLAERAGPQTLERFDRYVQWWISPPRGEIFSEPHDP